MYLCSVFMFVCLIWVQFRCIDSDVCLYLDICLFYFVSCPPLSVSLSLSHSHSILCLSLYLFLSHVSLTRVWSVGLRHLLKKKNIKCSLSVIFIIFDTINNRQSWLCYNMSTWNNEIIDIEERDGYNMEIMIYLGLIYIYLLNK